MGQFPCSRTPPGLLFPREAPSLAEPGQGACCSPPWQTDVPALGGDSGAAFPHPVQQGKLGGCHLVPGATELQLCFGPPKLAVCSAHFTVTGGESSCSPLIRAEQTGGCWHHSRKLGQRRSWKGDAALGQIGTMAVRLVQLIRLLRLWTERKSSMSAGNFARSGPNSPWCTPQQDPSAAPGAQKWRRLTLSYSWMLLVRGGWVLFPVRAIPIACKNKAAKSE